MSSYIYPESDCDLLGQYENVADESPDADGCRGACNIPGIKTKEWKLLDVVDIGGTDQVCEWCGIKMIRYVCVVEHEHWRHQYEIGRHCCKNITSNYSTDNPYKHRRTDMGKGWRVSKKTGARLRTVNHRGVIIYRPKLDDGTRANHWRIMVKAGADPFDKANKVALSIKKPFVTLEAVYDALFNASEGELRAARWRTPFLTALGSIDASRMASPNQKKLIVEIMVRDYGNERDDAESFVASRNYTMQQASRAIDALIRHNHGDQK